MCTLGIVKLLLGILGLRLGADKLLLGMARDTLAWSWEAPAPPSQKNHPREGENEPKNEKEAWGEAASAGDGARTGTQRQGGWGGEKRERTTKSNGTERGRASEGGIQKNRKEKSKQVKRKKNRN